MKKKKSNLNFPKRIKFESFKEEDYIKIGRCDTPSLTKGAKFISSNVIIDILK